MTETLQDRLRHGAKNIHSIGPDRAADLLLEAAVCFDHDAAVEANMARRVAYAQHDAVMWKRRCKRYEAWWALPQDQRHPGGPEFGGSEGFTASGHEAHGGDPETIAELGLERPLTPAEQAIHDRLVYQPRDDDGPKYGYRIDDRFIVSDVAASEPAARRAVAILHARDTATPHPKAEEWQKLIGGLRNKHEGTLNSPETRARIQSDIAGFMASLKDAPPVPSVTLDPVASDLPNGKIAFKVRVAPELAAAVERQRDEGYEPERCMSCGGDGYFHGPGLGDEPCPECDGAGRR